MLGFSHYRHQVANFLKTLPRERRDRVGKNDRQRRQHRKGTATHFNKNSLPRGFSDPLTHGLDRQWPAMPWVEHVDGLNQQPPKTGVNLRQIVRKIVMVRPMRTDLSCETTTHHQIAHERRPPEDERSNLVYDLACRFRRNRPLISEMMSPGDTR